MKKMQTLLQFVKDEVLILNGDGVALIFLVKEGTNKRPRKMMSARPIKTPMRMEKKRITRERIKRKSERKRLFSP